MVNCGSGKRDCKTHLEGKKSLTVWSVSWNGAHILCFYCTSCITPLNILSGTRISRRWFNHFLPSRMGTTFAEWGRHNNPPTARRAAVTSLSTGATQSKIATKILLRFSDRERIIWGLIWLPADSIDVAASSCASIFAVFLCFAEFIFMSHSTLKRGCERCLSWEERIHLLKLRINLDVSASMDKL